MFSSTVTLFNRRKDIWIPTVLKGVHIDLDKAAIQAKYGDENQSSAILHVGYEKIDGERVVVFPEDNSVLGKMVLGECALGTTMKKWVPPKEWARLEEYDDSLTFTDGKDFDFFYLGEWPEDPISDEDYMSSKYDGFYDYMNTTYDYVYAIDSVAGPYNVIPHFEVMGK